MKKLRFPLAVVLACAVTGGLFWSLWSLIQRPIGEQARTSAVKIEFTPVRKDTDVVLKKTAEKPRLSSLPTAPSVPGLSPTNVPADSRSFTALLPAGDSGTVPSPMQLAVGDPSRDVQPLVRSEPDYPARAVKDGIEGYVFVQFTITPDGRTQDVIVVDAKPQGVFDQSAVKAVARWRYSPQIVDGVAVERRGVQVKLSYSLEQ